VVLRWRPHSGFAQARRHLTEMTQTGGADPAKTDEVRAPVGWGAARAVTVRWIVGATVRTESKILCTSVERTGRLPAHASTSQLDAPQE
jgi:hypothetical protein